MRRRTFLGLLGLLGCKDELENMNISKRNWWLSGEAADEPIVELGTLYSQNTWANLNDFTTNGGSYSVISNQIQGSNGAGNFTRSLNLTAYPFTMLEKWQIVARVGIGTKTSTSYGFGFGIRATNATYPARTYQMAGRFDMSSTGGKVILNGGTESDQLAISASGLSFSVNDEIEITVSRNKYVYSVSAYNVTTSSSVVSTSFTMETESGNEPYLHNRGKFCMWNFGGTFALRSLIVTSTETLNPRIVLIGDSKISGYNASVQTTRLSALLESVYGSGRVVAIGGGSNGLGDWIANIEELQNFTPDCFLLCGASNDFRSLRSDLNITNDYDSLVTSLSSVARVVHTTGFYETAIDQSALQDHIITEYSAGDIIDTLDTVITIDAGIHPLDAGFSTLKDIIIASNKV